MPKVNLTPEFERTVSSDPRVAECAAGLAYLTAVMIEKGKLKAGEGLTIPFDDFNTRIETLTEDDFASFPGEFNRAIETNRIWLVRRDEADFSFELQAENLLEV